jgi:hypothetical protein
VRRRVPPIRPPGGRPRRVIFWIPLLMRCILIGRLKTAFEVAGERMSGLGNCWARPPRVRLLLLSQRRFLTDLRLTETGRDWKSIHPRRTLLGSACCDSTGLASNYRSRKLFSCRPVLQHVPAKCGPRLCPPCCDWRGLRRFSVASRPRRDASISRQFACDDLQRVHLRLRANARFKGS